MLNDERNVAVRKPIGPLNLIIDSSSSLNHSNAQVLEEDVALVSVNSEEFEHRTKAVTGVPLVVTFHPRSHNSSNTIRTLFIYLYAKEKVKKVFTQAKFVLFSASYSLRSHLVRAKVYLLIREKGPCCFRKSSFNIQETETFQIFVTKEVYKIKHHFHCDSKCVIYLISCKVCGLRYVESTLDRFCPRWNNYKCSQRIKSEGDTPKQNYFHQHFLNENHHVLLKNCEINEIKLIVNTDPSDPSRKKFLWMRKFTLSKNDSTIES